jgi:predicted peroxiredoxin
VPGLTIVLSAPDPERLRGALVLASAQAAIGAPARLFLQLDAVRLLAAPLVGPQDAEHRAAGLPTLAQLWADALDLGVALTACQSGLALAGRALDTLDPRIEGGGPLDILARLADDDRLVMA